MPVGRRPGRRGQRGRPRWGEIAGVGDQGFGRDRRALDTDAVGDLVCGQGRHRGCRRSVSRGTRLRPAAQASNDEHADRTVDRVVQAVEWPGAQRVVELTVLGPRAITNDDGDGDETDDRDRGHDDGDECDIHAYPEQKRPLPRSQRRAMLAPRHTKTQRGNRPIRLGTSGSYASASSSSGRSKSPRVGRNSTRPNATKIPRNAYSWVTPDRSIERTASPRQMP